VVTLRPVTEADVPRLLEILRQPQVQHWWGHEAERPGWPFDDPAPTEVRYAVLLDGAVIGLVQFWEELEPLYRHAALDIFLDPAVHNRGYGRDALRALARYVIDVHEHHRLTIDPAVENGAAIRCYSAVGFRPVGVMRQYERDTDGGGWHDGLLMELLAGELS
jgi:aminoglycoside 6'-N-acetyltransferase